MNTLITKRLFFGAFFILFTLSTALFGQTGKLERANKLYSNLAYIKASRAYLELAESGYQPKELLQNLGNCYYFNANYKSAAKWYGTLFSKTKDIAPIYYLRYAQSLNAINNKDWAIKYYNDFVAKSGNKGLSNAEYYLNLIEDSERYNLKLLEINSSGIDFGGAFYKDQLVFASTNINGFSAKKKSDWDGYSYLNLYQATINEDGSLENAKRLSDKINSTYHESSVAFTNDGQTMYFTRSNTLKESKKAANNIVHTKIYSAKFINGAWTNIEDLSINNNNFSNAHPALNANNDLLYFVSDRPQSYGETDIYVVKINEDGTLNNPTNLGSSINTPGRESFPFITPKNELFFSSDGHFGLGGLDVFYASLSGDTFQNIKNIGKPINSSFDDYAFVIKDKKGYISSNRQGGYGKDDIYSFRELKPLVYKCNQVIRGIVRDENNNALLPGSLIDLQDFNGNKIESMIADENAAFTFNVDCGVRFTLKGSKEKYDDSFLDVNTTNENNVTLNSILKLTPKDMIVVRDKYLLNINPIYFDLDKSKITESAARELENVVRIMLKYPQLNIEFGSHTDSRALDKYNWDLSNRRAKSTRDWIVNHGIDVLRIRGKGYGETQLVNKCSNGVRCSESEHQLNRRSEFVVLNPEVIK